MFKSAKQLAQAYVPYQTAREMSPPLRSLRHGTIFPDLYVPYDKECEIKPHTQREEWEVKRNGL